MKGFFFQCRKFFSQGISLEEFFSLDTFFLKSPIPLLKSQMVDPLGSFTSHSFIGRQRNVPKGVMPFQSCGFAHRTFFFILMFWLSSSLWLLKQPNVPKQARKKKTN